MSMDLYLLLCALIGLIGGTLTSFIGMGTGLIAVPFLIYYMPFIGVPQDALPEVVVGTLTACFLVTTAITTRVYHDKGLVNWKIVRSTIVTGIIGITIGTFTVSYIQVSIFTKIIALILIFAVLASYIRSKKSHIRSFLPKNLYILGFFIGAYTAFCGLTTSLLIPILNRKLPIKNSIGTACAVAVVFCLITTSMYIVRGLYSTKLQSFYFIGCVHWPTFIAVSTFGYIGARYIGIRLSKIFPAEFLKHIVSAVVILIALKLFFN